MQIDKNNENDMKKKDKRWNCYSLLSQGQWE